MVDDPNAFADLIEHADGRRFALVVSESPEALEVGLRTRGSGEIEPVSLEPYGVQLVDLTWMSERHVTTHGGRADGAGAESRAAL